MVIRVTVFLHAVLNGQMTYGLNIELVMTEGRNNKMGDFKVIPFEEKHIDMVIDFEKELRKQEPDTYFWEPDEEYKKAVVSSFSDPRFNTAISFIAVRKDKVIGRIDSTLIASRNDGACCSAYLDWICVLKNERHNKVAQALMKTLREDLKSKNVSQLIALMASNGEAQRFYNSVEDAAIHDQGIWMNI
jgi:GNAT superfamily N-acetyltransferase